MCVQKKIINARNEEHKKIFCTRSRPHILCISLIRTIFMLNFCICICYCDSCILFVFYIYIHILVYLYIYTYLCYPTYTIYAIHTICTIHRPTFACPHGAESRTRVTSTIYTYIKIYNIYDIIIIMLRDMRNTPTINE